MKKNTQKKYKEQLAILPKLHMLDVSSMLGGLHARILEAAPKGKLQYCIDGYSKKAALMLENAIGDVSAEKVIKVIEAYMRRAEYYPEFAQLSKEDQVLFAALEIVRHDAVIVSCTNALGI